MKMQWMKCMLVVLVLLNVFNTAEAQHSTARLWNDALLDAIRIDTPRPTVHARNLFHTAVAMYDAWAAYDDTASPFLLGQTVNGFACAVEGVSTPADLSAARQEAVSYAAYRVLTHRFKASPGAATSLAHFEALMDALGYDTAYTSTDYTTGSPAALGNYIAQCIIAFGLQDGSNEQDNYTYTEADYQPYNSVPMDPNLPGPQGGPMLDMDRWQPLTPTPMPTQTFLNPTWGQVVPFAMTDEDRRIVERDGADYWLYHDPGAPPHIDLEHGNGLDDEYKWTFALVALWSGHLDPTNGVLWDISPASKGNTPPLPHTMDELRAHYNFLDGGQRGDGHAVNPRTGQPYESQVVPLGDFARVLAEFWADGPNSETPPGHWFTILNYVNDHPAFEKRFRGQGPVLEALEWDVKAYLALGGAVHDAAVATWGVKGYYDYVRPITAIRAMGALGQSSDPTLPGYHPGGLPLVDGHIELVTEGDSLAGSQDENVGKVKIYAWRGHEAIDDPATDAAGVGWILAENWWPYQARSFVTPPFAGYTSGHSAFSRAAAEVLTLLTGDAYFPGGLGEFHATRNDYLKFENGPSVDVTLQWATYRDASDEASLSRIWGGIHPPVDDVPGRLIGKKCGIDAFLLAERYFTGDVATHTEPMPEASSASLISVYPSPIQVGDPLHIELTLPPSEVMVRVYDLLGREVHAESVAMYQSHQQISLNTNRLTSGLYMIQVIVTGQTQQMTQEVVVLR